MFYLSANFLLPIFTLHRALFYCFSYNILTLDSLSFIWYYYIKRWWI